MSIMSENLYVPIDKTGFIRFLDAQVLTLREALVGKLQGEVSKVYRLTNDMYYVTISLDGR